MNSVKFTRRELAALSGPAVYLYKHGSHVVYVGASCYGLGRALSPNHRMRNTGEKYSLEYIPCATANEAFDLEIRLIHRYSPKYNCPVRWPADPEVERIRREAAEQEAKG